MPQNVLDGWEEELRDLPDELRTSERIQRIEAFLDSGYGSCHLAKPEAAALVEDALLHFHGVRYHLYSWVIMPNHVHALVKPNDGFSLGEIIGSWKSFTANRINRLLGIQGKFWYWDYFDRYIRDEDHFLNQVSYIDTNPVAAGLCKEPWNWEFGSARFNRP